MRKSWSSYRPHQILPTSFPISFNIQFFRLIFVIYVKVSGYLYYSFLGHQFICKKVSFFVMGTTHSRESAYEIISRWNSEPTERLLFDDGRDVVSQYLQAVDQVQQTAGENDQIVPMAVTRLKHEFQRVLTRHAEAVMGSNSTTELSSITDSTSYQFRYEDFVVYEAPSAEVIQYLSRIAQTMNSSGNLEACIEVYKSVRRHFVGTIFRRLKLDELKAGDTRRILWEELKMKIERWIQAAKVCIKILFTKEKGFATQIFSGLGRTSTQEECFMYVAKDAAVSLFSFAESVSSSHQPSERLDVILKLYDAILSLCQDVNALFPLELGRGIRNNTAAISSKLGDEVRRMLSDFEKTVLNELSTISDDGGKVHSLTKNVMGYINVIVNYRRILTRLIVSRPSMIVQDKKLPDDLLRDSKSLSPLTLHLVLIIAVLQLNLENKSNCYKDASLGHLFIMNNVNYIVLKIRGSGDLQEMIGVDYLNKLNENVRVAMARYRDLTCDSLLNCLGDEGLYVSRCFTRRVFTSALRRRIRNFNEVFEKIQASQSSWEVNDPNIREELRRCMSERLIPAYERFLKKFENNLESGQRSQKCIQYAQKIPVKYSVQELRALVETNLFSRHQISSLSEAPVENFH